MTTPQTEASRLVEMADELERVCHDWTIAHIASAELRRLVAENSDLRERNAAMGGAQEIALDTATEHALRADELRDRLAAAEAERDQLRAHVERLQATEPFGYFRVDALGWADCASTDEGAIALYERPAAPAMVPWQPIETAPKDGTKILAYIYIDDGDIGVMKWVDFGQGLAVWVWADELMGDVDPDPYQPTHWMPLPPAPVGIGKDGVDGDV